MSFNYIQMLGLQQYERYLPSAFDESMSVVEKLNKIIEAMNDVIERANDLTDYVTASVEDITTRFENLTKLFEELKKWVESEGLADSVEIVLDKWFENGKLADIINQQVFDQKVSSLDGEIMEIGKFDFNGYNYTSIESGQYVSQRSKDLIEYARDEVQMDSIAIVATWFMSTPTSNSISRNATKTVPDSDVRQAIRDAKAKGYIVMLKPHVDVLDNSFRGAIAPTDREAWFASYKAFISNYALIAKEEGVDLLCIGTELKSSTKASYADYWNDIITSIKQLYTGKLTYASVAMNSDDYEEYFTVPFWGQLDYVGLDVYFKLVDPEISTPSEYDIASAWAFNREERDLLQKLIDFQKTINQPIIFTEIGCTMRKGSSTDPSNYNISPQVDLEEQARFVKAMYMVWGSQTSWMKGFFWWRLAFNNQDDFTFENRPSADMFSKYIIHTKGGVNQ
jgi:hypothetical protein